VKVQGKESVAAPAEQVFDLLLDPTALAACMPGCQELVLVEEGVYRMKMKVIIAALTGDFTGTVRVSQLNRPISFHMEIEGTGKIGHLKGGGLLSIVPNGDSTGVAYEGDVQIGGTMAAVGQRLIDATSKMMIRRFFGCLGSKLSRSVT
jgi:carbon monoxide dehydrogenase subunit G